MRESTTASGEGDARAVTRSYRDGLYATYVTTHAGVNDARARASADAYLRVNFRRHLPTDRSARIADIGCGAGELLAFLASEGYTNAIGVDGSAQQVELADARGIAAVRHGDASVFLAEHVGEFDAIFAIDLLEHLAKDEVIDMLRLVRAALRPGGRFVAQTCNAASPMFGRIRYGDFTHELAFTDRSIAQAFAAAELMPMGACEVEVPRHDAKSRVRAAAWVCVRTAAAAYVAIETGVTRGHVLTQNLIAVARRDDGVREVR